MGKEMKDLREDAEDDDWGGEVMTVDQALEHVGGFGTFQRWQTFSLGMCWLICGMLALGPVSWNMKLMKDTGWGSCQEEQLSNTIYFGAQFVANAFWGPSADRLGRRKNILGAVILTALGGAITAMARNFTVYNIGRSICGFGTAGMSLVTTVLLSEVVEAESRSIVICFYLQVFYALGMCLLIPSSFLFGETDWRSEVGFPTLLALTWIPLLLAFCRESPRFFAAKGELGNALAEIAYIGESNNRPLPSNIRLVNSHKAPASEKGSKLGAMDLFRGPRLRMLTMVMCANWGIIGCVYFGLTLASSQLGGSTHSNLFMSAAVEVPAYLISFRLMDTMGRRPVFMACNAMAALSCIAYLLVPPVQICFPRMGLACGAFNLKTLLAVCGKCAISGSFAAGYIYATEIFPTVVRNIGAGMTTQFANMGALAAPQLLLLAQPAAVAGAASCGGDGDLGGVLLLFGMMAAVGTGLVFLLPETLGTRLPETLLEVEQGVKSRTPQERSLLPVQMHGHDQESDPESDVLDVHGEKDEEGEYGKIKHRSKHY